MKRIIVVLSVLLIVLMTSTQNKAQSKPGDEKEQIIKAITSLFHAADQRNWQKIENLFADKVLIDYTSMNGGKPLLQTPAEITDAWKAFLPGFTKTHHVVSNFAITTKGNVASVHYTGRADHFLEKEVWTVSGTYDTELEKQNNEWRITKHKLNLLKQTGNTELPKKAMEVAKAKKSNP
jgi:hypothetical protein